MTASRLAENLNVYQFKLTEEEYQQITDLDKGVRIFNPAGFTHAGFHQVPYFNWKKQITLSQWFIQSLKDKILDFIS